MSYKNLRSDLIDVDPTGKLYWDLLGSMAGYLGAVVRLESAIRTGSPQLAGYRNDRDKKRGNLGTAIKTVNERFLSHQPQIKALPRDGRSIDVLVGDIFL